MSSNIHYIMKKALAFFLFLLPVQAFSRIMFFPPGTMDKVYTSIYEHLQLQLPNQKFIVSYYMEDTNLMSFLSRRLYCKYELNAFDNMLRDADACEPVYMAEFYRLFSSKNESNKESEYELWFSHPEYDLIACTLYKRGERMSPSGRITVFLFCFTPEGEIDYMSWTIVHRYDHLKHTGPLPLIVK